MSALFPQHVAVDTEEAAAVAIARLAEDPAYVCAWVLLDAEASSSTSAGLWWRCISSTRRLG